MEQLNSEIVSLIIPCYNGEKTLSRCLDSVLSQTYASKIQLILINDGSTDQTEDVINTYRPQLEDKLFSFSYVYQENGGVGAAVNKGLKYFNGEFLALLDADDYMMPTSIEKRSQWLKKNPQYAAVLNTGYYVTEATYFTSNILFPAITAFCENHVFEDLLDGKFINWPGTYMIRSSVWLSRCPDREIYPSRWGQNMQVLLPAVYHEKCGYLNEPLMRYLVQDKSLSHFEDTTGEQAFNIHYRFLDIYEHVICSICLDDKDSLLKSIRISSARTRLGVSLRYKNANLAKKALQELKSVGGCSLGDQIGYYNLTNPPICFLLRVIRKIHALLDKEGVLK